MARFNSLADRIVYERSFSLAERWERAKEKSAQFVAWHLLPKRVRLWVVVRSHADYTTGVRRNVHPENVKAFDLYQTCK